MRRLLARLARFHASKDGPTAVEYAVLLALIIASCLVAVHHLGRGSRRDFRTVSRTLRVASSGT